MRNYMVAVALAVIFVIGCAKQLPPGTERKIEGGDKPGWVPEPRKASTNEAKAFVGLGFKHTTERMALDYAKTNAMDEALTSMWGTYGQSKIREVCANAGVSVDEVISDAVVRETMTEWRTKGLIQGDFVKNHIEKWEKITETGGREYYYVAYRLFMVPRDMVKNFLRDAMERKKVEEANEQTQRNIEKALDALERMQTLDFEDW